MTNLWARFDRIATPDEVMDAKAEFTPVEEGVYKVTLEEIVAGESGNGLPMLKGKFRMIGSNRLVFYNQMLQNLNYPKMTAVNIAEAVDFISGILGEEVEFKGLGALSELISSIPIGSEHWVRVSYGAKDYDKKFTQLKIVEAPKDINEVLEKAEIDSEDIPF